MCTASLTADTVSKSNKLRYMYIKYNKLDVYISYIGYNNVYTITYAADTVSKSNVYMYINFNSVLIRYV